MKRSPDVPTSPRRRLSEETPAPRGCFAFKAELDLSEVDDRGRAGPTWAGQGCELSRSHLAFRSRRMCYEGRELLIAVHLIDDRPTPLFGLVQRSEYDGDGLYRTEVQLRRLPESDAIKAWLNTLLPRSAP